MMASSEQHTKMYPSKDTHPCAFHSTQFNSIQFDSELQRLSAVECATFEWMAFSLPTYRNPVSESRLLASIIITSLHRLDCRKPWSGPHGQTCSHILLAAFISPGCCWLFVNATFWHE